MKKSFIHLCVILVGIFFFSACAVTPQTKPSPLSLPDRSKIQIKILRQANQSELLLTTELVNTDASRTLGLSGRAQIGSDGMLFVFPKSARHSFWMKDMKIDLDLIWIQDKKIVDITRDVPAPTQEQTLSGQLPSYSPRAPVNLVLELPAGSAKTWNIQPGDAFEIR